METDSSLFGYNVKEPKYFFYEDRLETFQNWPRQIWPDKFSIAQAGFYYTGQGDIVKCFTCGVRLHQWLTKDTALAEHRKWSPHCVFLKIVGTGETESRNKTEVSFQGFFPVSG